MVVASRLSAWVSFVEVEGSDKRGESSLWSASQRVFSEVSSGMFGRLLVSSVMAVFYMYEVCVCLWTDEVSNSKSME